MLTIKDYDYVVFVYRSRFMGRQSKRLIKIVHENCKLDKRFTTKIICVNNDDLFVSMDQ
jgi:hypothetical protein